MNKQRKYSNLITLKRLLAEMWIYDRKVYLLQAAEIVFLVLSPLCGVILPAAVIHILMSGTDYKTMVLMIAAMFMVYGVISAIQNYFSGRNVFSYLFLRLDRFLSDFMRACIGCDYEYYEREDTQAKVSRAKNDGLGSNDRGTEGVFHDLTKVTSSALGLLVYLIIIGRASLLIVLALALLSLLGYMVYLSRHRKYMESREELAKNDVHVRYFSHMAYDVTSGKDIRLFQLQSLLTRHFENVNAIRRAASGKREGHLLVYGLTVEALSFLRNAVCYAYLIYLMATGSLPVSSFVLYLGLVSAFAALFANLTGEIARLNTDLAYSAQYFETMDMLKTGTGGEPLKGDGPDIVFDHVTFAYPGSDKKALDDLSLHIPPGETLALVGVNGAGKSTIVKLLCGLYHPLSGRILINGQDLETLDAAKYRRRIGVVFQDFSLFSFTIGENVSGLPEGAYDEEEVLRALERAGLKDDISSLEKGVHTFLGKDVDTDGIQLSGGQTQKILLARAFYKNPDIMILDEPTAALDAVSEQALYEQYLDHLKGKSALFISHRLASTRFCDRIILLKDGRIAEEGTHESLLSAGGEYCALFEIQRKYYLEGKEEDANEADI